MPHEWIEEYQEFEAVLKCTNKLPAWETDASMRAFAIYQWTDATTEGYESSLRHNESGTIIRHDGDVLAIEFGHGELSEALSDLFLALYQLGWRGAEVYHPAATLNELLADMGRAIPANLEFDVRVAKIGESISDTPEGKILLNNASRFHGELDPQRSNFAQSETENTTILETFRELGIPEDAKTLLQNNLAHTGAVNLIDDDVDEEEGSIMVNQAQQYSHYLDEEPLIPDLTNSELAPALDNAPSIQTTIQDLSNDDKSFEQQSTISPALPSPMHIAMEQQSSMMDINLSDISEIETNQHPLTETMPPDALGVFSRPIAKQETLNIIKTGNSFFCFDTAHTSLSTEDLQSIIDENRITAEQITHIWPGAIKGPIRWNFLGEIDDNHPWMAEKLASRLIPTDDSQLIASIFLALKHNNSFAGLRDLLMFAGKNHDEMVQFLDSLSPATKILLDYGKLNGSITTTMSSIVYHLGALAFVPDGQSFVDLLTAPEELSLDMQEAFTVREIMQSSTPRILIVHTDILDNFIVNHITETLKHVADLYSSSKRFSVPEVIIKKAEEPSPAAANNGQINADVTQILGNLFEQLQKIGVSVPLTAQGN